MVGLWYYNLSGVTELMISRDPHCARVCFKSVKTLGTPRSSTFLAVRHVIDEIIHEEDIHNIRNYNVLEV